MTLDAKHTVFISFNPFQIFISVYYMLILGGRNAELSVPGVGLPEITTMASCPSSFPEKK